MLVKFEKGAMTVDVAGFVAVKEILMPAFWNRVLQLPSLAPGLPSAVEIYQEEFMFVRFNWPGRISGKNYSALFSAPAHALTVEELALLHGDIAGDVLSARTEVLNGRTVVVAESQMEARYHHDTEMAICTVLMPIEGGKMLQAIELWSTELRRQHFMENEVKAILDSVVWEKELVAAV